MLQNEKQEIDSQTAVRTPLILSILFHVKQAQPNHPESAYR